MSDEYGNTPQTPGTPPAWEPVAQPVPPAGMPPPPYQQTGYPPPPPPGYPPPGYAPQGAGLSSHAAAAISYITFIPAVIFLVIDPYKRDPLVRFHAWQCIALTLTSIVITLLFIPLAFLHVFGLGFLLHGVLRLLLFIAWLIAIIKASRGEYWKIPIVGDVAEKLATV